MRVLLRGVDLLADLHVLEPAVRELPVTREATDAEVHAAVGRGIGDTLCDEGAAQVEHQGDVLRRARLVGRRQAADPAHVGMEGRDLALGQRGDGDPLVGRPPDHLVVDVGEIPDEGDTEAPCEEVADEDVGRHEGAAVPDVGARVHRDAAPVDADVAGLAGPERLLPAGERVGQDDRHAGYSSSSRRRASTA